jgi:hypothetical protein
MPPSADTAISMHFTCDSENSESHGLTGDDAVSHRTYTNPILDKDFPDPAVIHAPDVFYYAYATQTLRDG